MEIKTIMGFVLLVLLIGAFVFLDSEIREEEAFTDGRRNDSNRAYGRSLYFLRQTGSRRGAGLQDMYGEGLESG